MAKEWINIQGTNSSGDCLYCHKYA